ncbi:MAG: hypothetical protein KME64_19730 [Scytonematopsis contorta HA4267-MV1]|jgi:hypothetical protein|nr:hypothetical protein [Scytonematopsis contorta HA4267-MV1]
MTEGGKRLIFRLGFLVCLLLTATPAWCQTLPAVKVSVSAEDLDLSPEIIESSPVLQRWLRQVPNVLEDIKNDPSFPTRLRFGYALFPSNGQSGGVSVGIEDIFIGDSRLTISGDYQVAFNGQRQAYGADLRYYLRPLGSYINIAPVLGYRYLKNNGENNSNANNYSTSGVNIGVRLLFVLSRGGGADISLTQSWVAPGTDEEVGLTTLSFAYAVTKKLRFSTDIQKQNARQSKDSRVGLLLEWML